MFTFTGNILSNETNHGTVLLSGARNLVVTGGVIEWHPPQDTTLQQESMLFATQGIVQEIETLSAQIGKDEGEEKSVGAMTLTTNTALGPSSGYCCVNHAL
jgi:hypothetical protein